VGAKPNNFPDRGGGVLDIIFRNKKYSLLFVGEKNICLPYLLERGREGALPPAPPVQAPLVSYKYKARFLGRGDREGHFKNRVGWEF